jgi:hypothetical protein
MMKARLLKMSSRAFIRYVSRPALKSAAFNNSQPRPDALIDIYVVSNI